MKPGAVLTTYSVKGMSQGNETSGFRVEKSPALRGKGRSQEHINPAKNKNP